MTFLENHIYLASHSLRRRELLKQIGVKYKVLLLRETLCRPPDIDETPLSNEAPIDYVYRITHIKAEEGWKRLMQRKLPLLPMLVADTVIALDGYILGKPRNMAHAEEMLWALSGRTHQVLTAIAVIIKNELQVRLSTTTVRFREIGKREIRSCLANNKIYDMAGAYAIQGIASAFIVEISGSYSGVMGLPLFETAQLLEESGIEIFP
ncbi:septum formation protein [Nitrosomonas cryotolerans]|uniref:dTTP/UTP pyrophosphatase n=1 Tax=Nitrosomonas cryotolerans ATCC 49181 TaxID=1131553 RepID=A0A1N6INX1_9PROT|nr:Maf family protein [Nitrosomonas cryotolerans]SFP35672.1 septum formation protein [Nitrosomonas cryotolerans]SIO33696.1 septum formation protein [Nitrosomonas cryotolerans ATCC 49181]